MFVTEGTFVIEAIEAMTTPGIEVRPATEVNGLIAGCTLAADNANWFCNCCC